MFFVSISTILRKAFSVTENAAAVSTPEDGFYGDVFNGSVPMSAPQDWDVSYSYDEIGNLTAENSYERVLDDNGDVDKELFVTRLIDWNTSGKVTSVEVDKYVIANSAFYSKQRIVFGYDATGNRVTKEVKNLDNSDQEIFADNKKTFYLRDASGNILSVYERRVESQPAPNDDKYTVVFAVKEIPIYGSDRLGMALTNGELYRISNIAGDELDNISFDVHNMGINNKLYHWITPRTKEVELADGHTECNCALEQLLYTDGDGPGSVSATITNQFLGRAGNNVVVAESDGVLQFYAVTAESYLGNKNVALVLDRNGNLLKGASGILSEHQAKGLALQNQGNRDLWYLLTVKDGQVYYTEINTAAQGFGLSIEDPAGEVTANKNMPLTPAGEHFGRHMAAIEDGNNNRLLLYMLRYNQSSAFNAQGTTDIVVYEIAGGDLANATETVLAQVDGLDEHGDGELQVSPDGKYLMLFNRTLQIGGFEHRKVDLVAMRLNADMLSVDPMSIDHIETRPGGAWGKASADFSRDPVTGQLYQLAQQQSTVLFGSMDNGGHAGTDKPFLHRLFSLGSNTDLEQNQQITHKADIRQGKTMQVYLPGSGQEDAIAAAAADGTGNTALTPTTLESYLFEGGLPGQVLKISGTGQSDTEYKKIAGNKRYELKDHLGNVRATVTDRKYYTGYSSASRAEVASVSDYYPFGMQMPNRSAQNDQLAINQYRFGFNGMEKSPEINDNHYTAKFWEYDARIGRRWNIDPVDKPWESSYATFYNSPILIADPLGLDGEMKNGKWTGEAYDKDGNVVNAKGLTNDQMTEKGYSPLIGTGTTDGGSSYAGAIGNNVGTSSSNYWNSDGSTNWDLIAKDKKLYGQLMRDRTLSRSAKKSLMNASHQSTMQEAANITLQVGTAITPIGTFGAAGKVGSYLLKSTLNAAIDASLQYSTTGDVDLIGVGTNFIPGDNLTGKVMQVGIDAVADLSFNRMEFSFAGDDKTGYEVLLDGAFGGLSKIKLHNSKTVMGEMWINTLQGSALKSFNETAKRSGQ